MYGCESWTVKKAECRKTDAFELWYWRTLESFLDCKEIQPSILKEISSGWSLEGLMLKLKLWYFGHVMWRADSLEKTLMLGRIGGRRRRGWQRMRCLDGITNSKDMGLSDWPEWHDWVTDLTWSVLLKYRFLVFIYDLLTPSFETIWASLIAQLVKNPLAMQETLVWFLGGEDPLEKG